MEQPRTSPNTGPSPRTSESTRKARDLAMGVRRPKIALACEECRARKVRCDGGVPSQSALV
jgi:hypothetical protein